MRLTSTLGRRKARIEIIPLIDIIFFLLATFVMVSLSMVKQQGIPVQLPGAATAEKISPQEADATLTVAADGTFFWNREARTLVEIRGLLRTLAMEKPEARLAINGDAEARLGSAIDLLDAARSAGLTRVGFQTKPKATPP